MSLYTSVYCETQKKDISDKLIKYRGVSENDEIDYNGIKYKAGNLMGELRKDYNWWESNYNEALISEGNSQNSSKPEYKLAKGWEI